MDKCQANSSALDAVCMSTWSSPMVNVTTTVTLIYCCLCTVSESAIALGGVTRRRPGRRPSARQLATRDRRRFVPATCHRPPGVRGPGWRAGRRGGEGPGPGRSAPAPCSHTPRRTPPLRPLKGICFYFTVCFYGDVTL